VYHIRFFTHAKRVGSHALQFPLFASGALRLQGEMVMNSIAVRQHGDIREITEGLGR
jgi:hypothetical protein